jgi:hypothetical protein
VDSLRAVELVTATGEVVRASGRASRPVLGRARRRRQLRRRHVARDEVHPVGLTVIGACRPPVAAARDVLHSTATSRRRCRQLTAFAGVLHAPTAPHEAGCDWRATRGAGPARRRWRRSRASAHGHGRIADAVPAVNTLFDAGSPRAP